MSLIFKKRLTPKQKESLTLIILSLILIIISYRNNLNLQRILFIIGFLSLITNISLFFKEKNKKKKIVFAKNSKNYDSFGEKKIADYLERKNIKFYLHPKIKIPSKFYFLEIPFKKTELKPDFFLPEFNLYIEYWGRIENEEYKKIYKFKKKKYKENDIELLSLYPKNLKNLDWAFTQKLLEIIKIREGINRHWE